LIEKLSSYIAKKVVTHYELMSEFDNRTLAAGIIYIVFKVMEGVKEGLKEGEKEGEKEEEDEDELEEEEQVRREKYLITLRFEKPISRELYVKAREERIAHADVLNFGASSMTDLSKAAAEYSKAQLPRYRGQGYSIYRALSESVGTGILPLGAVREIGAAKELIDTLFLRNIYATD
jgi:hypothetical protein